MLEARGLVQTLVPRACVHVVGCSAAALLKDFTCVKREVEAMQRLGPHENVVNLLDVYWDVSLCGAPTEYVVLALELAPGGELFDYLSVMGRFPEPVARAYFKQLLDAIAHCHVSGVFHRDLKLDNLLMVRARAISCERENECCTRERRVSVILIRVCVYLCVCVCTCVCVIVCV
jgi:hypothetical protein